MPKINVLEVLLDNERKSIKRVNVDGKILIEKSFFQHENQAVYQLLMKNPHPNICRIVDVRNEVDGFVVLEEDLGEISLDSLIPITDQSEYYRLALELCDGLQHLHQLKIVHRDLKPSNIYIVNGHVVLNDFDIAKPINETKRKDTHLFGSLGYASPEQYGFSYSDHRSDIYTLGILFSEMLSGELILDESKFSPMNEIILKCIQINPLDRYQSIQELKHDILRKKNQKSKYTLPGFRTGKLRNKIIAVIAYVFILFIVITVQDASGTTFHEHLLSKILMALMVIPVVMIATNYLNVHSLIPRPLKKTKFIKYVVLWAMFFVIVVVIFVILSSISNSLLAAYQ